MPTKQRHTREQQDCRATADMLPCAHRGATLNTIVSDRCGTKGQPFDVLSCEHPHGPGRCTVASVHTRIKSCLKCSLRAGQSAAPASTLPVSPLKVSPLRVTVAIICHNYGRFLDACIASVAAQTQTLYEVFVVDDASDDNTAEVCERRGMRRIAVNHRDVHRTRKTALEAAGGDVIIFLDADDELTPDYVRTGLQGFTDPRVAIVYSDVEYFENRTGRSQYPDVFDRGRLWRDNYIHAGSLVRCDALRLAGVFDVLAHKSPSHMDWTIWKRVIRAGFTACKQPALYRYRQHGANMLQNQNVAAYFDKADLATETLTIFVPLSGRLDLWQAFSNQLTRLTWPRERTTLILCDTSQQHGFSARVAGWVRGCDFPDVRHVRRAVGPPNVADHERRNNAEAVANVRAAMAKIYNWARENIATDYTLILEDDIWPEPADLIERLLVSFDQHTDAVAAPYASRYTPSFVAWRRETNGQRPIPLNERGSGVEPIGGTGFGCLLLRTAMLRSTMFSDRPHLPSGATSADFDIAFFQQAQHTGRLCKLDWSIVCDHGAIPDRLRFVLNGAKT